MAKVARHVPAIISEPLTSFREEACLVELSQDQKRILVGGSRSLSIIDAATGADVRVFRPDDGALWSARFTADSSRVVGGIGDHLVVWNAKTGSVLHDFETNGIVRRISISHDGKKALASTWQKDVRLWDITKGKELGGFTMEKSLVNGAALSPDAKLVACGGSDGIVRLIDPISGDVKKAMTGKGWIEVIERAEDGAVFATAGREAQVIVWDWTGEKIRTLTDVSSGITVLALSPDGKFVAACGKKATPLVWNIDTGEVVGALEGHDKVTALSFSRDGHAIVTAGPPCIRVWNAPE